MGLAIASPLRMSDTAPLISKKRRRRSRYRRRLRSRIIVSFVLLGTMLTGLFAYLVTYVRAHVENQLIEDVMNRNIDEYARRFYQNPARQPDMPVQQMRALALSRDKFEELKQKQPDWYESTEGIHNISGVDEDGRPFAYKLAVRKMPNEWFFLAYDVSQGQQGEQQLKRALFLAVIFFCGLSLLIGWRAASRVMRPVSDLASRLRAYRGRQGHPKQLAPFYADDEVGELARAFDEYALRLTKIVQRDREFNADVSHELRTPLAVIRGATELLLVRPDLDPKIQQRLQRIQRAEQQCSDLIGALLLLSRNERGQGSSQIRRVAEQLIDSHRAQLAGKPIVLELSGISDLVVDAPESVISVALGNLIGNAVKYTQEGQVTVFLSEDAVEVRDTGPGLSKEDGEKLFQRGYRGTFAGRSQGAGIGLSIVSRLCDLYGWSVRVDSKECGVVARLQLKPAGVPKPDPLV